MGHSDYGSVVGPGLNVVQGDAGDEPWGLAPGRAPGLQGAEAAESQRGGREEAGWGQKQGPTSYRLVEPAVLAAEAVGFSTLKRR